MTLSLSHSHRLAFPALAALVLTVCPTFGQDKQDAKAVVATVKDGAGLAKVKELIAADPRGARFRIDGLALSADGSSVKVTGVMLVPGATDEQRLNAADQTRKKIREAIQKVAGAEKFEGFDFDPTVGTGSVKEVQGEGLPHLQLQRAANTAGAKNHAIDELKLADAKFEASGRLVLIGVKGPNPETQKWLTEAIPTVLVENAAAIGPNGKLVDATGKSWVTTDKVELFSKTQAWPVTPAAIQKALVQKNAPALARLRVDRLYFVSSPDKVDDANPTGVSWTYALSGIVIGTEPTDANAIAKVCEEVFAASRWPAMKNRDLVGISNADFRVPDPGPRFQKAIAAIPALDGVRVDDLTEFGESGQLILTGLQPELDEAGAKELNATVIRVLNELAGGSDGKPLYRELSSRGVSTQKMHPIKIRQLLAELRKWVVAERMDDVRLTRLYFNRDGLLTLICDSPEEESKLALAKVTAELSGRLASYKFPPPLKRAPAPAKDDSTGTAAAQQTAVVSAQPPSLKEPIVEPGPNTFKNSLTSHLQAMVTDPKSPQWTAVLIEQGYFNDANQYTIRGVVDSEEQKKQLVAYLNSLKSDPQWTGYFIAPVAASDLDVLPMAELVKRVQRVAPAYEQLDGIRVTKASYRIEHDAKTGKNHPVLVFSAHLVGRMNPEAARKLTELIQADAGYFGKRLPKERGRLVEFAEDPTWKDAVPINAHLAHFANGYAANFLARVEESGFFERGYYLKSARDWLDAALLHSPDQSSLWFLSAYYHFILGDRELAKRDLYRVITIEDPIAFNGRDQRVRRYEVAKDLQGVKRDELEKLWAVCWKEVTDGAKPIGMAHGRK